MRDSNYFCLLGKIIVEDTAGKRWVVHTYSNHSNLNGNGILPLWLHHIGEADL